MKSLCLKKTLIAVIILMSFANTFTQISIPDFNPVVINFTGFTGTGFTPDPAAGQLDADDWSVLGLSDGNMVFGDTKATGDFARGSSAGNVTTGGIYAFDVGAGNIVLGVQPGSSDWTPGSFILRVQNNTGINVGKLDINYSIFIRNDQGWSNSFNFSHSSDNITYTPEPTLAYASPDAADPTPAWTEVTRSISLTGLNIANLEYFYIRWDGDDVSGSGSRDEFGLDNISITATAWSDTEPPVFISGTPRASDIRETQFDVVVNLNEMGTVYFLVKNHGELSPTREEVRNGDTLDIFMANSDFSTTVDTVNIATTYDVYFLAEDLVSPANVQDTTTLLEITTLSPRSLDLVYPEGGENFYVGDTMVIRWASENIDSIQLWARGFEEGVWYPVLDDENKKLYAGLDSLVLPIPRSAGLDSTYFRLTDANDFNFFDSCGVFYLIDTLMPQIAGLSPYNHKTNVGQSEPIKIGFDEAIFLGTGTIFINRKADHSNFDSIPVSTENIEISYNIATIHLSQSLENGTEYYIYISKGSFVDYQDNPFAGILNDTTWTFKTIGPDLFFSEYVEGGSNRKALEIYNPTADTVLLDDYRIAQSSNGGGWAFYHYFPGGKKLPPKEYYVIVTDDATYINFGYDPANADEVLAYPSVVHHTGNDARAIEKNIDGNWTFLDIIGDPNSSANFDVAGITGAATNHTLLRKNYITQGSTNWIASAGTNAFDSEWKVMPQDYLDNLGLPSPALDTLVEIISFTLTEETGPAVIDSANATVDIEVVLGTQLDSLFPVIVVSEGAFVEPASGDSVDFSAGPVIYTVYAEDHSHIKVWTVTVTEYTLPSSENKILSFVLAAQTGPASVDTLVHQVSAEVKYGTELTSLTPTITISGGATIDPLSGAPQDFSDTVTYTVTAQDGTPQIWKVIVKVQQPVEAATMADLRALNADNKTIYRLTGEVILSHALVYRNKKYVQDATGGIEIDDLAGKITTVYNYGDGIAGLTGTLEDYYGLLQIHPVEDPGPATSTGNTLTPVVVTAGEFNTNHNNYEGELVKINRVTFADTGANFTGGSNYVITQETTTAIFRAHFYEADYIGTAIPSGLLDITGICIEYNGTAQLVSRFIADIESVVLSNKKDILTFTLPEQTGSAAINNFARTVTIEVDTVAEITTLVPTITISAGATISPESGVVQDFTSPVEYTVTAEDGSTRIWTVTVTIEPTSIEDLNDNDGIMVYPNPGTGSFKVSIITDQPCDVEFCVLNLNGQVVYSNLLSNTDKETVELDLQGFEPGIYILKINTGSEYLVKKLVIE